MSHAFTILNVDSHRNATQRALRAAGFRVLHAETGRQALQLAASQPDLILLEMKLPDMSGIEVCKRLKGNPETALIPVVYLSADFGGKMSAISALDAGGDAYLAQPVRARELVATVRALLRPREPWRIPMPPTRRRQSILCIDDSETGLSVRRAFLEANGYEVLTATTGAAGVRDFAQNAVDLVVLDYNMPDMDGERVALELRQLNPRVPILLLSAYADTIPKALFGAIDAFVAKGQHPTVLLEMVHQLLQKAAKKPAGRVKSRLAVVSSQ